MTSYEAATLLIKVLSSVGIKESGIEPGGVYIQYRRHQIKDLLAVLNGLSDKLNYVSIAVILIDKGQAKKMYIERIEGKPIRIAHKGRW